MAQIAEPKTQPQRIREWCMTCHKTIHGIGAIHTHRMLGHDVDVPSIETGSARPTIER